MVRVGSWALGALAMVACASPTDRPARWSYIHAAILEPSCATATCHSRLTAIAGVDLSSSDSAYTVLLGVPCGGDVDDIGAPRNYVTPGSADYSTLMYQLRGQSADGTRYRDVMPPDLRLPSHEIELIARWIDEGATCE